jgi:hypothetical protein
MREHQKWPRCGSTPAILRACQIRPDEVRLSGAVGDRAVGAGASTPQDVASHERAFESQCRRGRTHDHTYYNSTYERLRP